MMRKKRAQPACTCWLGFGAVTSAVAAAAAAAVAAVVAAAAAIVAESDGRFEERKHPNCLQKIRRSNSVNEVHVCQI